MIYDHLIDLSIFILYICNPKSAEKAPIMYSIKAAILNSLRGKNPTNNKSDDYKNLPYF